MTRAGIAKNLDRAMSLFIPGNRRNPAICLEVFRQFANYRLTFSGIVQIDCRVPVLNEVLP